MTKMMITVVVQVCYVPKMPMLLHRASGKRFSYQRRQIIIR